MVEIVVPSTLWAIRLHTLYCISISLGLDCAPLIKFTWEPPVATFEQEDSGKSFHQKPGPYHVVNNWERLTETVTFSHLCQDRLRFVYDQSARAAIPNIHRAYVGKVYPTTS